MEKGEFKEKIGRYFKDKHNLIFTVVFIIALILRLKFITQETIWNDETFYIWYALKFMGSGSYFLASRFAGVQFFELIIAFFKLFTSNAVAAGRITALFFSMAGIVLIYKLGTVIKNKTTGLIAAILLSVHHLYWFIGNKVLLDAPSATMFIFTAYCLIMYDKKRTKLWTILLPVAIALTLMTKVSNILIIPSILLYFFFVYFLEPLITKKDVKKSLSKLFKRKSFYTVIILTLIFLIPYFINNLVNFSSLFPFGSGIGGTTAKFVVSTAERGGNYFGTIGQFPFYLTWYLIPFFIIGLIFNLIYRKKRDYLLISLLLYLVFWTILTGGINIPRYGLPAIPIMLLIAALALSEIRIMINKFTKLKISPFIFVVIAVLLAIPFYNMGNGLFISKSYTYTGYEEAGQWARENIPKDSFFIVGSPGFIRLFSGYEFIKGTFGSEGEEDGTIYYGLPQTPEEFEQLLTTTNKEIYLELDMWEYVNQGWVYPLTQEKLSYIQSLGFQPVYIVEREVPTQEGLIKTPVVFIFKKA